MVKSGSFSYEGGPTFHHLRSKIKYYSFTFLLPVSKLYEFPKNKDILLIFSVMIELGLTLILVILKIF